MTAETTERLAVIRASGLRRAFGAGLLGALGAFLAWVALADDPAFGWRLFLLAVSVSALWLAVRLWQATGEAVELTADGLRESSGRVIAPLSQIEGIDRGLFAFKPSNGFTVRLNAPAGRAWAPGLWWRLGRRVGVGGVTSANEAKFAAEMLVELLAERRA